MHAMSTARKRKMRSWEADPDVHAHLDKLRKHHTILTPHINAALRQYFAKEFGWTWKKRMQ